MQLPFSLDPAFVDPYRSRPTSFGWNGLGEFVFKRTYARDDESWVDVCLRVINGMFSIQKVHCDTTGIRWDEEKAQRAAKEAFDLLFDMKWTPPGRGLWMMGT
ncbi:MAG: fused protease/ribonucleoside-triphosphate reductase, partial [Desulfurellales bacterium]